MISYNLYFLAFIAGIFLSMQSGFNAQLGVVLKNPFLASFVAYGVSTLFALAYLLTDMNALPKRDELREVPSYLWIIGGFFSVLGVSLYYYLIPKIGIAKMFTFGLSGQMIFVMIAGYFGWFNLPVEVFTFQKILGVILLLMGVGLITL
jgi:transporter family-2 protein